MKRIVLIVLFLLLPVLNGHTQSDPIARNKKNLQQLNSEIKNIRSRIENTKTKTGSLSDQLKMLNKEASLIARAKGLLARQQQLLENRLTKNKYVLRETKEQLKRMKDLYADRLVYMYKFGTINEIALILQSKSLNQALTRYRYFNLIAEHNENTIQKISEKQQLIEKTQIQLTQDLEDKNRSINEKILAEQDYKERINQRNGVLKRLKSDQTVLQSQLVQKEKEREKLTSIIAALERERKRAQQKPGSPSIAQEPAIMIDFDDFKKGKGKLPWPVRGKVLSKFGKDYDPLSKTYVTNSGIEISSKTGSAVKSVFRGVVRMITYISGYGNTAIVDHGNGYYSVYSHLGEIYVSRNDVVETNQVIAAVGDSGSLAGDKLHFEIYGGNQAYDPLAWLNR